MGGLYAALYLSPRPVSLDELAPMVGVTKGAIEHQHPGARTVGQRGAPPLAGGDRKDYYEADTDFWKIAKTVLERRQKPEFDAALRRRQPDSEDAFGPAPGTAPIANWPISTRSAWKPWSASFTRWTASWRRCFNWSGCAPAA